MTTIYKLICPVDQQVRYVGKTIMALSLRLNHHLASTKCLPKTHVKCWIKSLADKGLKPKIEIIEVVEDKIWQDRERFWIKYYRDAGIKLTNICDGGKGNQKQEAKKEKYEKLAELIKPLIIGGELTDKGIATFLNLTLSTYLKVVKDTGLIAVKEKYWIRNEGGQLCSKRAFEIMSTSNETKETNISLTQKRQISKSLKRFHALRIIQKNYSDPQILEKCNSVEGLHIIPATIIMLTGTTGLIISGDMGSPFKSELYSITPEGKPEPLAPEPVPGIEQLAEDLNLDSLHR